MYLLLSLSPFFLEMSIQHPSLWNLYAVTLFHYFSGLIFFEHNFSAYVHMFYGILTWWNSIQVMYDATGVRLHAGRQAEVRVFAYFHLLLKISKLETNWRIMEIIRYWIKLYANFHLNILSLRAGPCANFLVTLLRRFNPILSLQ